MSRKDHNQRLAAIFAADVAGYSRLMAVDERATLEALEAAREVFLGRIEANQGRVIDMAGDSVLAVFETATGAVTAAIDVQKQLNDGISAAQSQENSMRFRIGVHLGDIIEKPDGSIYGDGVNIAARLESLARPGCVMVSEVVHSVVRDRLDASFEDMGEHSVKNIARLLRGFQTIPGIKTSGAADGNTVVQLDPPPESAPPGHKPSIAVMPFSNMSDDPQQEYFSDGITEDIITELSRFHSLSVIARNSTFGYKGKTFDVRDVGRELGADYVIEGSVRKARERVRVTAQLIDATSGSHLWAERYDRDLEDIFLVQEQVTQSIVARLQPELELIEQRRAIQMPTRNLGAWDLYHSGLAHMYQFTPASNQEAQRRLRQAIGHDSAFALAYARLAYCMVLEMVYFDAKPAPAVLDDALQFARTAVSIDGQDAFCQMALGRVHIARREYDLGRAACESAVALNPNMGIAHCGMGDALAYAGSLTDAVPCFEEAIRLSPNDPWRWAFYSYGALALIFLSRFDDAVDWARKAILVPNCQYWAWAHLGVALAYLGRTAEAAETLAQLKASKPDFTVALAREQLFYLESNEQVEFYLEGLSRAGLA